MNFKKIIYTNLLITRTYKRDAETYGGRRAKLGEEFVKIIYV